MIKSMTGFGRQQVSLPNKTVTIDIKSLNSKQLDINARLPLIYKEKELTIRSVVGKSLIRGKVDISFQVEQNGESSNLAIDRTLAGKYYHDIKALEQELGCEGSHDILPVLVRLPDVVKAVREELDESEWDLIMEGLTQSLSACNEFRLHEGEVLENDFRLRTNVILSLLNDIAPLEGVRIDKLRKKFQHDLAEVVDLNKIDQNRFEQEVIYYIEKLDITEEKVRLKKHCDYFFSTLNEDNNGKKLHFIAQEMGREINTIGSKANDAEMQRIVVQMKDELEKIKEQLMNIL